MKPFDSLASCDHSLLGAGWETDKIKSHPQGRGGVYSIHQVWHAPQDLKRLGVFKAWAAKEGGMAEAGRAGQGP
jgi:hypothetical protein